MSNNKARGDYILQSMNKIHLSGDSYADIQTLFNSCSGYSDSSKLQEDMTYLYYAIALITA